MTAVYGVMWDSASGAYPPGSKLNAYYYNGLFLHRPYRVRPGAVWIDVFGSAPRECSWLDVEKGAANTLDVARWLDERNIPADQGIYCNRSNLEAVETVAAGRPHNLWVATLDGTLDITLPVISGKIVAVQAIPSVMLGFNADESFIVDDQYWFAHVG